MPRADYKFGFQIRLSITFSQKKKRYWFLMNLRKLIGLGVLRQRGQMADLTITGYQPVAALLHELLPYLKIKLKLAHLLLNITQMPQSTPAEFLKVCALVDRVADYTDSKKRLHTAASVHSHFSTRRDLYSDL